jgi:hypothetical protein
VKRPADLLASGVVSLLLQRLQLLAAELLPHPLLISAQLAAPGRLACCCRSAGSLQQLPQQHHHHQMPQQQQQPNAAALLQDQLLPLQV